MHEKKMGDKYEKRNLDIKEWYFVKLLSLWTCKLQHVCSLLFKDCFVNANGYVVIILQFFLLLKVATTYNVYNVYNV